MICFPNAKINLGLNITEKRSDGFHNIETVFYPIAWCDALEAIENKSFRQGAAKISLSLSGLLVAGNTADNLITKAYNLLDAAYNLPPVNAHLQKTIPMGAGLGGGSADAAFFIKLLNDKFALNLSIEEQVHTAKQLGSDCAFFIANKAVYASEKGDVFTDVSIDLSMYCMLVVYPAIHSNTALAYKGIVPAKPEKNIRDIILLPVAEWKHSLVNDFEKNLFAQYPELQTIKDRLYDAGAIYASMSGSGSAMYALFEKDVDLQSLGLKKEYTCWKSR